jgi:hypothetical protein
MPERPESERRRIDVNAVQVVGSALAAISSAFLLSTLGVAGTVIGAALASVVATVGSAVYVHLFRRTGDQLRDVRAHRVPPYPGGPSPDPADVPDRPTGVAAREVVSDETIVLPVGGYEPFGPGSESDSADGAGGRGGKRIWLVRSLVGAVVVFVVAMGVVTLAETALGRSFASLFGHGDSGGSTISNIVDDKPARKHDPTPPTATTPSPQSTTDPGRGGANPDDGGDRTGETGSTPTPTTTATTPSRPTTTPQPTGSDPPTTAPPKPPTVDPGGPGDTEGGGGAGDSQGGAGGQGGRTDPNTGADGARTP